MKSAIQNPVMPAETGVRKDNGVHVMKMKTFLTLLLAPLALLVSPLAISHSDGGSAINHGILHMLEVSVAAPVTGYIFGLILSTAILIMVGLILRQVVATRKAHQHLHKKSLH